MNVTAFVAMLGLLLPTAAPAAEASRQFEFFEQHIRPVLIKHCYRCHSANATKVKGGLLLDTRDGLRKGGSRGPALVPGNPGSSLLLKALRYEDLEMPPSGKLPDKVIADFEKWIKDGAADPREAKAAAAPPAFDREAARRFWAFRPPARQSLPHVRNQAWPAQPIDFFILARLEQAGFEPAPAAGRRTWLRRISFDLIGLPPTPEKIEAFVHDASPDAYERVVDDLLASPHFGEHWARMWLDVARYGEDQAHIVGNDRSLCYPDAYLYRDWVIRTLNQDTPYDRFVELQLAADLLEPDNVAGLPALGFLGLGPKYYDRRKLEVMADEWEDRVDVVGRGLLGLTVACARCHDHKYDPIPTEDYYALAGVFASSSMYNRPLQVTTEKKPDKGKEPKDTMHIVREDKPTDLSVFVRGDVNSKGAVVKRHFLHVLSSAEPKAFPHGSGRQDLAEAIASRDNPLTARVFINRVWAQCFGRGLVGTPSNFGSLGDRPSHPELLDDLAVRFMDSGWSLKSLLREITLSAAYRQSSSVDGGRLAADPDNVLLGRMRRRRLNVEAWRDALLAATGNLDDHLGGPSIDPLAANERRRTVYSAVSRLELNRLLALFDFPDPNVTADRRVETTTPVQKLFVLNSPFMLRQAAALAGRLAREIPAGSAQANRRRIERAYQLLYGRRATKTEVRLGLTYLEQETATPESWKQYAQVLLAANEMMFLD
ncbi:MAG: DUF1553 domain-containing protein [Planctomycetota bacterium]|nr:MAG: DUF1553 domain-containing protein [Planctomycetota bacterium]